MDDLKTFMGSLATRLGAILHKKDVSGLDS